MYTYIYIPAGILCGMSLSHPTPAPSARATSSRPHRESTKRKGPQPYDKGSLAELLSPGPRISSSTICHRLLKSHRPCAKKAAGESSVQQTAEPKSRDTAPVPTAKLW